MTAWLSSQAVFLCCEGVSLPCFLFIASREIILKLFEKFLAGGPRFLIEIFL